MKVALVGCAPTWKDAPYSDESWRIWAHASCQPRHLPRADRWYEIHPVKKWRQGKRWYTPTAWDPSTYVEWLQAATSPVIMQQHYPIVPRSKPYPLREIVEAFGIVPGAWNVSEAHWWTLVKDRGEFSSTAAYMLAHALFEGASEISLCGIDFSDSRERLTQRCGMKYWVGVARGLGVPVTVARDSWFEYQPSLYGYERG